MTSLLIAALAFQTIASPKDFFGHEICEDYQLVNYRGLSSYWARLAQESPRIKIVSIGKTEEGRDQFMAIVSEPTNLRRLEAIRRDNVRLASGRTSMAEAKAIARRGKAIVWIDGGLHASEVLGAQQLLQTAYDLVSRNDEENRRILRDCVVLLVHANPDGMDLVSDWYMRRPKPEDRALEGVPVLYQKYAGHDNNRDFFASNLAETRNMNRILYREWLPQIVYNHHQSAPSGTIMFIPPFRNPFNYHVDPLNQIGIDLAGVHMHQRLIAEGLGGTVMRGGAPYSGWWNGGLRTTTYFHNMIGILTETWGSPNPTRVPFVVERQVPISDLPKPIDVRMWHLRDSLRYEVLANYALLDYASRYRERVLFDNWTMAMNSIERGSRDSWTRYSSRVRERREEALSDPALRDARAYVLPSDQPDFSTAKKLADRLMFTGIEIERTTADGKWPKGSLVVRGNQPFRPHVLDMFEAQDHPNDFQYPGGPPIPPYDNAGYTLAFQMGVQFERVLDDPAGLLGPTERIDLDSQGGATLAGDTAARTWIGDARQNDTFALATAAAKVRLPISRTTQPLRVGDRTFEPGSVVVEASRDEVVRLLPMTHYGDFFGVGSPPPGSDRVKPARIALWDRYGGSMPSGWMRHTLEAFGFDYEVVFPPDLDYGRLAEKYDVVLLPSGAVPARDAAPGRPSRLEDDPTIPFYLRRRMGSVTAKATLPKLKEFLEAGGRVMAIGSSALNLTRHWKLPVNDALVENGEPLPNSKFYIPGSLMRMRVLPSRWTLGLREFVDVVFDDSPAFRIEAPAKAVGVYEGEKTLRSGWAWGQERLAGAAAIVEVPVGKGTLLLVGPEINFRAQPHGSFKLLFNTLFVSAS
ncbi:MAG TPA: M14 family metallopeptidase [Fimbriimonadaceae bacterium]|nr:M14 family metallopeptidase [Fimbriimonadaceae bacterium]HRJ97654.1 M14 family metallopeptidase [Fimbriimonadaceae bacterium]